MSLKSLSLLLGRRFENIFWPNRPNEYDGVGNIQIPDGRKVY